MSSRTSSSFERLLLKQELALPIAHRNAAVEPDHAMPWKFGFRGGEDVTDQAGCSRVDVAISAYESNRDCTDSANDALNARVEATLRRHHVDIVWGK